jgi:integrase
MYPHFYPVALFQLGMGLRIGEVVGLRWDDFDLKRREARIERNIAWNKDTQELQPKKRKNAKILETVIPHFLVQTLEELSASREPKQPYLFHRDGALIRRQQIAKAYNRVLEKLEIRYVKGTHMLRKTSGTLARKLTRDVYAASKLLDHSSVTVTEKHYQEQLDEDKHLVADALNGAITEAMVEKYPPQNDGGKEATCPPVSPQIDRPKFKLIKSAS